MFVAIFVIVVKLFRITELHHKTVIQSKKYSRNWFLSLISVK